MRLRVLHNGDLRKETAQQSPHWVAMIGDDGSIVGEVLMRDWGRFLPKDFRIPNHSRFFEIPSELRSHQLTAPPHFDEIIVSLERHDGQRECVFLMSQLPASCRLHTALSDLLARILAVVDAGPN